MLTRFVLARARMRNLALVLCAVVTTGGCASYSLMPTPLLYAGANGKALFTDVDTDRTVPIDLLYVTDRGAAQVPLPQHAPRRLSEALIAASASC